MGLARDNLRSTRSREEIVRSDELRLKGRMLRVYLDTGAYEAAIRCFLEVLADPKASPRTRGAAARAIASYASRMLERGPAVAIDARSATITAADFLALAEDPRPIEPSVLQGDALLSGPASEAGSPPALGVAAEAPEEAPVPNGTDEDHLLLAPSSRPRPPEDPRVRCPDCRAEWEEGHERSCPVGSPTPREVPPSHSSPTDGVEDPR